MTKKAFAIYSWNLNCIWFVLIEKLSISHWWQFSYFCVDFLLCCIAGSQHIKYNNKNNKVNKYPSMIKIFWMLYSIYIPIYIQHIYILYILCWTFFSSVEEKLLEHNNNKQQKVKEITNKISEERVLFLYDVIITSIRKRFFNIILLLFSVTFEQSICHHIWTIPHTPNHLVSLLYKFFKTS